MLDGLQPGLNVFQFRRGDRLSRSLTIIQNSQQETFSGLPLVKCDQVALDIMGRKIKTDLARLFA